MNIDMEHGRMSSHNENKPAEIQDSPAQEPVEGWRSVLSAIFLMTAALLIALIIAAFIIQSYQVDGESMEPTLQNNDRLIVNKVPRTWASIIRKPYIPDRNDIIIFNQTAVFKENDQESKQLIKRVVGLPGERVVLQNGNLTIYNAEHPFGFNPDSSDKYKVVAGGAFGNVDLTLASDEVFVLGDNRPNSQDSGEFGPVDAQSIVGELILRIMPLDKVRTF